MEIDEEDLRTEVKLMWSPVVAWALEHRMSDGVHVSLSGVEVPPPEWLTSSVPPRDGGTHALTSQRHCRPDALGAGHRGTR